MEKERKSSQDRILWGNPYGWLDLNRSSNGVNGVAQEGIKRLQQKGLEIVTVGPHVGDDKDNVAKYILGNTVELPSLLVKLTGTTFPFSLPFRKELATELILATQPDALFLEQPDQGFAGHSLISGTQIENDGRPLIPIMTRIHSGIYSKTAEFVLRTLLESFKLARRPRFTKLGLTAGVTNTVFNNLQLCLVTSEAVRKAAEKRYGKRDYQLLPNGIDVDKFTPDGPILKEWKEDGKEIILIAMGRLEKRKGVIDGLEAYKIIKAQRPNTKLIILGDGPERKPLEQKVKQERIEDVEFTGRLSREIYVMALRTADVGLYPAERGEGWGIVVGEGLASGLLSVVSNIPGYNEVTENGQPFALMAEPKNPQDIANKALEILNLAPETRQKRKWQAPEYVRSRFASEKIAAQLSGHIQNVLKDRRKVNWEEAREKFAKKPKFFPPRGTLYTSKKD